MEFNVADLFEAAVDKVPDREIIVCGDSRATFRELDERASQVAHYYLSLGLGQGDYIGIYAYNSLEWVEAMLGAYKIRAIPININYRYVEDELRYLFDNADIVTLVFESQFKGLVAAVKDDMPKLAHLISFDGDCRDIGAVDFEEAIESQSIERDFESRSADDLYVLYTGGTTGMPKGVMWRQEDVMMALGGGIDPVSGTQYEKPEAMIERIGDFCLVQMPLAPLMHGAAQWALFSQMLRGYKIVMIPGGFDAHKCWELAVREKVNSISITGDATGRPLVEALAEGDYDLSNLHILVSTAAIFSHSVKKQFFEHKPELAIIDAVGSSEQGTAGLKTFTRDNIDEAVAEQRDRKNKGLRVDAGKDVTVLGDNLEPLEPGSGEIGRLARGGNIPLGYFKDEKKTRETFVTASDGKRWAMAGDMARLEADGTITLLGRGSGCINSGGEKIFPEEVEDGLKAHADIYDCLVVGVPDDRWGQRVSALVQLREGATLDLGELQRHARTVVAGYKIPREMHIVEQIKRAPSGKPDYRWAKQLAESDPPPASAD